MSYPINVRKTAPVLLVSSLCVCVLCVQQVFECCAPNFVSPHKSCGFYCASCSVVIFRNAYVASTQNQLYYWIIHLWFGGYLYQNYSHFMTLSRMKSQR